MKLTSRLLGLGDILALARDRLVPREPLSLYRYIELLVQLTLLRKHRFGRVLETGPGIYPVFSVWPRESYGTGAVVDYSDKVLGYCREKLAGLGIETIALDFDRPGAIAGLGRKWDLIISNGVLEHLRNDREHISDLYDALEDGGTVMCVTVLHEALFNDWDRAVGHYRRYSQAGLLGLFERYSEVQVIRTSLIQELVRPLFFGRIRHMLGSSIEENNRRFGNEVAAFSRPPYSGVFWLVRWALPAYLVLDWWISRLMGGIVIVIARK